MSELYFTLNIYLLVYINYQSYLSWSIIYWFKYCYYRVFIWKYFNLQRRGFYYSIENLTLRHIYQWSLALCAFESMNKNKYVKVKMINLREHMGTPPFFVGSVLLIFLLSVLCLLLCLSSYCVTLVYPMLPASLDCYPQGI